MKTLSNIHPGEVLLEEFLAPLGISQNALARAAGVPPRRINEIVLGKRGVSADTAVRLAAALGTTNVSGWACRPTTTSKKPIAPWARR
jgi:addiction module HigA family antidote